MHEKWYLKFRSDFLDQVKTLITENIEKDEQRSLLILKQCPRSVL